MIYKVSTESKKTSVGKTNVRMYIPALSKTYDGTSTKLCLFVTYLTTDDFF